MNLIFGSQAHLTPGSGQKTSTGSTRVLISRLQLVAFEGNSEAAPVVLCCSKHLVAISRQALLVHAPCTAERLFVDQGHFAHGAGL
jgi:hypothetical protein